MTGAAVQTQGGGEAGVAPLAWFLALPVIVQFAAVLAAISLVLGTIDRSAFRVLVRVALVALPLFGLGALILHHLALDFANNDRLMPALLAGGVVALGWLVTFGVQEYRRDADYRRRQIDVMTALQAEIYDILLQAAETDTRQQGRELANDIAIGKNGEPYHVFSPTAKEMVAFAALAEHLDVLPDKTVQPIVAFYTQTNDLRQFSIDLQRPDHHALSAVRRSAVYDTYVQMRVRSEALGHQALAAINDELGWFRRIDAPTPQRDADTGEARK